MTARALCAGGLPGARNTVDPVRQESGGVQTRERIRPRGRRERHSLGANTVAEAAISRPAASMRTAGIERAVGS
ncbi:MAG TPA: hypothetical protein PKY50_09175 [Candidatus Competibacter sp.]|nr:hypothetical protein [Candidatus Competibacter sp.]